MHKTAGMRNIVAFYGAVTEIDPPYLVLEVCASTITLHVLSTSQHDVITA